MKRIIFIIVFLSLTDNAQAFENDYKSSAVQERWSCVDDSTGRTGNVWDVCGVAQAKTEANARQFSLDKAIAEFKGLCDIDTGCKDHQKTVNPKRTSCKLYKNGMWKCWRMLSVIVDP